VSVSLSLIVAIVAGGLIVSLVAFYVLGRTLAKREPYQSFLGLRSRGKLRFFKLLLTDNRVPLGVRGIPLLLIPYLAMPFDIVPDFIPVLGYIDDVAIVLATLALIIWLTPRTVVDDLIVAAGDDAARSS